MVSGVHLFVIHFNLRYVLVSSAKVLVNVGKILSKLIKRGVKDS